MAGDVVSAEGSGAALSSAATAAWFDASIRGGGAGESHGSSGFAPCLAGHTCVLEFIHPDSAYVDIHGFWFNRRTVSSIPRFAVARTFCGRGVAPFMFALVDG